jgi:hypothetical protein
MARGWRLLRGLASYAGMYMLPHCDISNALPQEMQISHQPRATSSRLWRLRHSEQSQTGGLGISGIVPSGLGVPCRKLLTG